MLLFRWSDPDARIKGFQKNKVRAVSFLFGEDAVRDTLKDLNIQLIVRAHQVIQVYRKLKIAPFMIVGKLQFFSLSLFITIRR